MAFGGFEPNPDPTEFFLRALVEIHPLQSLKNRRRVAAIRTVVLEFRGTGAAIKSGTNWTFATFQDCRKTNRAPRSRIHSTGARRASNSQLAIDQCRNRCKDASSN